MTKACPLCDKEGETYNMKRTCPSKKLNIVLAASLALLGVVDKKNVDAVLDDVVHKRFICHSHVAQAARYLCAEMAISGKRFSYYEDPTAQGSTAYVNTADIPPHLVGLINGLTKSGVVITVRDVCLFINSSLKKYHGTYLWPEHYEEEGVEELPISIPKKSAADTIASLHLGDRDSVEVDGELDADDDAAVPEGGDVVSTISMVHSVGPTDAADLQKNFLVKGEMLMKMLRFCPECGHRLNKTQLKAVRRAAMLRFVCDNCIVIRPPFKKCQSRGRVVDHLRERMYKGNVAASESAVVAGLQYANLARWAEQFNLSMFSKSSFAMSQNGRSQS